MEIGSAYAHLCIDIRDDGCVGLPSGGEVCGCGLCVSVQGLKAVTHIVFLENFWRIRPSRSPW